MGGGSHGEEVVMMMLSPDGIGGGKISHAHLGRGGRRD
jgi:hypothetical protein